MSAPNPLFRPGRAAAAGAALALAGCAMPVVAPPPVPPPVTAAPLPAPASASGAWAWTGGMDAAASRLRISLVGSGVDLVQTTDQRLWLSAPAEDSFAAGRSALTPAAGSWLDRVAAALRDLPNARVQIVGPPDARGGAALALDRAASARDWLVMRGVPARRFAVSAQAPRGKKADADSRLDILIGERTR